MRILLFVLCCVASNAWAIPSKWWITLASDDGARYRGWFEIAPQETIEDSHWVIGMHLRANNICLPDEVVFTEMGDPISPADCSVGSNRTALFNVASRLFVSGDPEITDAWFSWQGGEAHNGTRFYPDGRFVHTIYTGPGVLTTGTFSVNEAPEPAVLALLIPGVIWLTGHRRTIRRNLRQWQERPSHRRSSKTAGCGSLRSV